MAKIESIYAKALFEISEEGNTLEKDLDDAIWIRDSLSDNEIQAFLLNPAFSDAQKTRIFSNTFSNMISKHMMGFLHLMVRKNHESYITTALSEYIEAVKRHFGRIDARLVSASPMTSEQIDSISKALTEKLDLQAEIKTEIDPDLIGGFYLMVDGKIFDNTIRSQINSLKRRLYKGNVLARIVSAKPLSEEQISSIYVLLKRKFNTEVEINAVVDPSLIGGFYIVADGYFFDNSVRTSLREMKKNLKRGKL